MDIQSVEGAVGQAFLDTTREATAGVVTSTIHRLNTGRKGLIPVIDSNYLLHKNVVDTAYSEQGIGTRLNIET